MYLLLTVFNVASNDCVVNAFLLQEPLNVVHLRHEPSHDDELLIFLHDGVDNVGECVKLCRTYGVCIALIVRKVTARNLR